MIISQKSKQLKEWLPLVFLLVVGVVVCLLAEVLADRVEPPGAVACPYQTEAQTCPYQ